MNILFSCGDYYPSLGGATSLIDDLAQALQRRGHVVTVLTRRHGQAPPRERWHGYEIHRLDYPLLYERLEISMGRALRSLRMVQAIRRLLRDGRIDVVCIGLLDMSAWYLLALRRVLGFRLVVYLHGGETRTLPIAEASYARLLRTALREADAVIAVSKELKEEASRWTPVDAKTTVIVNAIDLERIGEATPFQHPRPYIAAVGRLVPAKDFGTLLRAYARVEQEIGEIDLIIAGEGRQRAKLEALAGECLDRGRVTFLGRVERETALSVMRGALLIAMPSVTEGFPIVAVEALAMSKPILGSNIPGIAAIVQDGIHGRLFPPGDAEALASLLREYCRDDQLLRRTSETDLRRYDMEHAVVEHLRVYEGQA